MKLLGISAFYHDSAAALVEDGAVIAAVQEERFTRKKHDAAFPVNAIRYCLEAGGWALSDIDHIIFYDKPFLKFERLLETYVALAPRGFASFATSMPVWVKEKLLQKKLIVKGLQSIAPDWNAHSRLLFSEHHLSHAASAFYPSPFDEAAILTIDGVGEWVTTSVAIGRGADIQIMKELHFPHSLGLLYSAFTYYLGFKVNSGEYKLMGLAPYGTPIYRELILDKLIDLKADGSFSLNMDYFGYCTGLRMVNKRFCELFGLPPRTADEPLLQMHMDIAASIQSVTEEAMLRITRHLSQEYGIKNLCLAGGVALNCVANGKILKDGGFDHIWVQPAAGDAGGALGAALVGYHMFHGKPRQPVQPDGMQGSFLGPEFSNAQTQAILTQLGARFELLSEDEMITRTADALEAGSAVGWMQGRMEFGPRALGNRSIIADPRNLHMQKNLNLKIKFRESFRPFAPSVLREEVSEWFDMDSDSPYMLMVAPVREAHRKVLSTENERLFGIEKLNVLRSDIPAVTHVDYSARIQTVHAETNPLYAKLLHAFKQRTGCPVLVNTSFNVRSEPIVCTPEDAFRCFMGCNLDMLVIGNCVLEKNRQDPTLAKQYVQQFELD